tara:strand:+ start:1849 stop:1998 length:150 start_codon:yes stop_codon:yes gene_type:complete
MNFIKKLFGMTEKKTVAKEKKAPTIKKSVKKTAKKSSKKAPKKLTKKKK